MNKLKYFFSYHPDIPFGIRRVSFLWLFPSVFCFLAIPYIIIEHLGEELLFYVVFIGISGLFISYGLSRLKRWSIYLSGLVLIISSFISREISILFLIAFIFVVLHWKKFS